jgi:serine/threonine protein kinase
MVDDVQPTDLTSAAAEYAIGTGYVDIHHDDVDQHPRTLPGTPLYFPIDEHFQPKYHVNENVMLDDFSSLEYVSEGKTSVIFRATWRGEKVIVKMLHSLRLTDEISRNEFIQEYQLLIRCQHPNIIRVLGYGVTKVHPMTMVEGGEGESELFIESGRWDGVLMLRGWV